MKPRLVQMIVQPVMVGDDGENLVPLTTQQIIVSAADWPAWAVDQWPQVMEQMATELAAAEQPETDS